MTPAQRVALAGRNTSGSVGPPDPFYANVRLLLHGNGPNGSGAFVDSGPNNRVMSARSASISTTQSKFGGSSILIPVSGYVGTANIAAATEFTKPGKLGTIEFFLRGSSFGVPRATLVGQWLANLGWTIDLDSVGQIFFSADGSGFNGPVCAITGGWDFLAVVNDGTDLVVYFNGVNVGTIPCFTPGAPGSEFRIGCRGDDALQYGGYIEEFRYTSGTARYSTNFVPPTAPFSNF